MLTEEQQRWIKKLQEDFEEEDAVDPYGDRDYAAASSRIYNILLTDEPMELHGEDAAIYDTINGILNAQKEIQTKIQ